MSKAVGSFLELGAAPLHNACLDYDGNIAMGCYLAAYMVYSFLNGALVDRIGAIQARCPPANLYMHAQRAVYTTPTHPPF